MGKIYSKINKGIRKSNKLIQDYLKPKRLALGKYILDRKAKKIANEISLEKIKKEEKGDMGIIEARGIKSIIFMRYDGKLGDMVVNSFIFREIKKEYPNIKIGLVIKNSTKDILKDNSYIDKFYNYENKIGKILKLAKEIKKDGYDLLVDFNEVLRVRPMLFIKKCEIPINIGINKENWNLFDYSYFHPKEEKRHIQDTYISLLNLLGIKNISKEYDIYIDKLGEKNSALYIERELKGRDYILFNPYAASKHRSLNFEKILEILSIILEKSDLEIVLVGTKDRVPELEKVVGNKKNERLHIYSENLLDTIAIIKNSKLVITPDTSIVHIASAFKKYQIDFYREDLPGENNVNEWGPNSEFATIILSKTKLGIGEKADINNFDMVEFQGIFKEKIQNLDNEY